MFAKENMQNMQNANFNLEWKLILKHVARVAGTPNKAFNIDSNLTLDIILSEKKIKLLLKVSSINPQNYFKGGILIMRRICVAGPG